MSDQPSPGATALINGNAPPQTREDALARREQLFADPEYRASYLKGDQAKVAEVTELHRIMTRSTENLSADAEARMLSERMHIVDTLRRTADIPDAVADMVLKNTPVTAQERRLAEDEKGRLFKDREFVRKYMDGDRAARTRVALIDVIMARPVLR